MHEEEKKRANQPLKVGITKVIDALIRCEIVERVVGGHSCKTKSQAGTEKARLAKGKIQPEVSKLQIEEQKSKAADHILTRNIPGDRAQPGGIWLCAQICKSFSLLLWSTTSIWNRGRRALTCYDETQSKE